MSVLARHDGESNGGIAFLRHSHQCERRVQPWERLVYNQPSLIEHKPESHPAFPHLQGDLQIAIITANLFVMPKGEVDVLFWTELLAE